MTQHLHCIYFIWHHIALHWHYITLPYILHYITLHYTTLHYTTLHYITLHYIRLRYITYYFALHYTTLHYIPLHYITLHYILLYITYYFALHYITLRCITRSHYIPYIQLHITINISSYLSNSTYTCVYIHTHILLGGLNPSEKILVNWHDDFQYMEK